MASVLIDAKTDFEKVGIVLNINSGFISGKRAVSFDLLSLDELLNVFNLDNMPFKEILSFLNERTTIQNILMDFENNKDYIWWNSKDHSILMIITMYYITGNEKKLKNSLYLIIKMINVEDGIRMYYDISKNQIIFKLTNSKPTE